jgi:hypothetical protein
MVNKTVAIFITILLLGGVIFTPEATPSNAQADLTSTPTPLPTETLAEVSSPTPAETGTPTETPTSTPEASSTPEISVTDTLTPISEASATVEPVATLTLDISPTLTPMPDWALPLPTAAPEAQTSAETGTLEPTATPSGYDGGGQTRSTTSPACAANLAANQVPRTAAGVGQLNNHISAANANPTSHYIITLTAGVIYSTSTPRVTSSGALGASAHNYITGCVTIKGNGAIIERSFASGTPLFRVLTVNGGFLRLENVVIRRGRANWLGGGGILNREGTLQIHRSTIINNRVEIVSDFQTLGGGIYSSFGSLSITESRIINNRALNSSADGGGIAVVSVHGNTIDMRGNEFSDNLATFRGNAVYIMDAGNGVAALTDNCFLRNYYASSSTNSSIFVPSDTLLERSWWGSSAGPIYAPGAVLPATATRDSLAGSSNYTPVLTALPANCTQTPPVITPTPSCPPQTCSVPTATVTPDPIGTIIQDLNLYGITVYATGVGSNRTNGLPWSLEELQEVQEAVHDIARAFNLHLYNNNSGVNPQARELFRNVIKQVQSGTNLEILRVNNNFLFGNGDPCDGSQDEGCTSNGNTAIALYGNFPLNGDLANAKYTVVHELGHRFENQSSTNAVIGIRERMDGPNVIEDCQSNRIMGTNAQDLDSPNDWKRGLRGWGTQGRSLFQQNPLEIIDLIGNTDEFLELSEAAADMFLNWVYRRLNDPVNDVEDYCTSRVEVGQWLGFRNIDGNGQFDASLPGNSRFAWMQTQIEEIFTSQTGWR